MTSYAPRLSVIVPVRNRGAAFAHCLDALLASTQAPEEILVVDDASEEDVVSVARARGVALERLPRRQGPAGARNQAARRASGDVLVFIDADVAVRPGTLSRIADSFHDPGVAAVFGSYDADPSERNFVSQYKNLTHHFVHQGGKREASSFWTGCGAVRRGIFEAVGGFDPERCCMEDVELGYRMSAAGHRILLDKELQVRHLKRWSFRDLLREDVFCRAVPWSRLILERGMPDDLNVKVSQRLSAAATVLATLALAGALLEARLLWLAAALALLVALLNLPLYRFFFRLRGARFTALAFGMQLLYYVYSTGTFAILWLGHQLRRRV